MVKVIARIPEMQHLQVTCDNDASYRNEQVYAESKQYLQGVQNLSCLWIEDSVGSSFFGYLTPFDDRTVEDIGFGVFDFTRRSIIMSQYAACSRADKFRKLATSGGDKHSRCTKPDLAIRRRDVNDCLLTDTERIHRVALQTHCVQRLAPWSVMAYVKFKNRNAKLHCYIRQCTEYCYNLLRVSPDRHVVFCALYLTYVKSSMLLHTLLLIH